MEPHTDSTDTSMSLTPPILQDDTKSIDSISEHISVASNSNSNSIERDRSLQEIDIDRQLIFGVINADTSHLSQETKPFSISNSDNSIINVQNLDSINEIRGILEQILDNSQFNFENSQKSSQEHSQSNSQTNSKEVSLNIFENLDLNDKSLTKENSEETSLNVFENLDLSDKSLTKQNSKEESLNTLENLDPNDKSLSKQNSQETNPFRSNISWQLKNLETFEDVGKKLKEYEEILSIKDAAISALSSELESYREISNPNTNSMSTTEYKQLQEECHNRILEYNNAIIIKNDLIQQLSESLDQSVTERKLLLHQIDGFKAEVAQLQIQLQETKNMVKENKCDSEKSGVFKTDNFTDKIEDELDDSEEWPLELSQFRQRLTKKYEDEIERLKKDYNQEINILKDELSRRNTELDQEPDSLDDVQLNSGQKELIKERNMFEKQSKSLRNLLGELLKYFNQCEDELNNTLVEELVRQGFEKNMTQFEEDTLNDSSSSRTDSSFVKRVQITPNLSDLFNKIENRSDLNVSGEISMDVKNGLATCLEKLKQDANAILALTTNLPRPESPDHEEKINSLNRQISREIESKEQLRGDLNEALQIIKILEKEKECLENQLDEVILKENMLGDDLTKAKDKIAELIENGHKEIISEGYGDVGHLARDAMQLLSDVQEKARNMMAKSRASADPLLLDLIEELCRVGEQIKEESKRDRIDFLQQIDAADKKYKHTHVFLEEQAAEREMERDEAQKKIDLLYEQLRERDKDRSNYERSNSEVEVLEQQLNDLNKLLSEESKKFKNVETERNEAVEKIKVLRDIIRDLETQTELSAKQITDYLDAIEKLQSIINQQNRAFEELKQSDTYKGFSDISQLREHIEGLERELQQLRVTEELAGNEGVLKQIKAQLFEIEVNMDKKTKILEGLYSVSNNSCSSPSEDMSVRDMIRPHTPNSLDECEVPLQQLSRLKEKLLRHSRAEDAAVKRIRDLEMQMFNVKTELDEVLNERDNLRRVSLELEQEVVNRKKSLEEFQNEKDILKRLNQEHLVLIADLQIRLEEQRIRAEHIEKETNTSLELKIYDQERKLATLQEEIRKKDKNIGQLNALVEETKARIREQQDELNRGDNDLVISMQKQIEKLSRQNQDLKAKLETESQVFPNLVENILAEKNTSIEKLSEKLNDTQKLLESYTRFGLDLRELEAISQLKSTGNNFSEFISAIDISNPETMREQMESQSMSLPHQFSRSPNNTVFIQGEPEISRIEKLGPPNVHFSQLGALLIKPNSTELQKTVLEKRVHFEDEELITEIKTLKNELEIKDKIICELEEKLKKLQQLENKVEILRSKTLDETENALKMAQQAFETEHQHILEREQTLRVQLAAMKLSEEEHQKELEVLKTDSTRKDQMLLKVTKNKRDLENEITHIKGEHFKAFGDMINDKNGTIEKLREKLDNSVIVEETCYENFTSKIEELHLEIKNKNDVIDKLNAELENKNSAIETLENNLKSLEENLKEEKDLTSKLHKEIENNKVSVVQFKADYNALHGKISKKRQYIKELEEKVRQLEKVLSEQKSENKKQKDLIIDKDCEIQILNEDLKTYQNEAQILEEKLKDKNESDLQKQFNQLSKLVQEKELIINNLQKKTEELDKELIHSQDLLVNKDKIIDSITEEHKVVNTNLLTIQKKLKEPGGYIESYQKLKEEQKKNGELLQEINLLKVQLMSKDLSKNNDVMVTSVDDITGQLKRELDYSAQIDTNIMSAVSDHSLSSISDTQDFEVLKKVINKEKARNRDLVKQNSRLEKDLRNREEQLQNSILSLQKNEERLEATAKQVMVLKSYLTKEKLNLQECQLEDAKLLEQLRIKLDTEHKYSEELSQMLEKEISLRKSLEIELENLKQLSKSESTEYKNLPNNEQIFKKELEKEIEKNSKLANENRVLKNLNLELENNFRHAEEMLNLNKKQLKQLQDQLDIFVVNDRKIREILMTKNEEIDNKNKEIDNRNKEIDSNKYIIDKLTSEKDDLFKKLKSKTDSIPYTGSSKNPFQNEMSMDNPVHESLMKKIKEINNLLTDNKQMVDLLKQIQSEKHILEKENIELKKQTPGEGAKNLTARCDFLFAKYMRESSYRKALIWQKRYLMNILNTHEKHCHVQIFINPRIQPVSTFKQTPLDKFRSAVFTVTAILRMQYMVRRWKSGRRATERLNHRHLEDPSATASRAGANFHVGQPVSSQRFATAAPSVRGAGNNNGGGGDNLGGNLGASLGAGGASMNSWTGYSPPQKLRSGVHTIRIENLKPEELPSLRSPQLLAQFAEKFDSVSSKLALILD